jgi:ABC-type multidrug transport system ATPase subunit
VIKMLTTLLPPTSGRAYVAGHDVVREPADVRRHIISGGESSVGLGVDFLVLGAVFVAFVFVASRLYESIVR